MKNFGEIFKGMKVPTLSCIYAFLAFLIFSGLNAQTIAEKKAGFVPVGSDLTRDMQTVLVQLNKELNEDRLDLNRLYAQVYDLYSKNAPEEQYKELLEQINAVKQEIADRESSWREMATSTGNEQAYALWHQPESNLGQLVNDYGAQNFVYVMPPEIAGIKVSVASNIPIPRSSWNEMMELILAQNGVGYKQLNPYLRQLYFIRQDKSSIRLITNKRDDLQFLPSDSRICFVITTEPSDVRRVFSFLEKFINPQTTILQMVGRDILAVASVAEIQDLLKLYDFVIVNKGDKDYKIRTVNKVQAEEMAKILAAIFDQLVESPKPTTEARAPEKVPGAPSKTLVEIPKDKRDSFPSSSASNDVNGLKIIPLSHIAQAIFLVGTKEEIKKAEEIIDQVETQIGEARSRQIYWYTTKHSDPEDLAQILEKIYELMIRTNVDQRARDQQQAARRPGDPRLPAQQAPGFGPVPGPGAGPFPAPNFDTTSPVVQLQPPLFQLPPNPYLPSKLYQNDFYQQGGYVVNPAPVEPRLQQRPPPNRNRNNFIVDLKTGAIVMVVEADIWPKLKELIKKLDIPKKMVQIEALVFEKRLTRHDNFGLNLLRIGDGALNKNVSSLFWNNIVKATPENPFPAERRGVFQYILSHKGSHGVPAFDLAYKFLITQDDVQINANPSVVTVNQVPARISIVEEISINTGIFLVDTVGGVTPESAFTRAQYGINIIVTPTIHTKEENPDEFDPDDFDYVSLDTDITFDTVQPSLTRQPDVIRRHVTNQVRIPDGQTVVIGGLRRKNTHDGKDSIPYLGEIPGFGKLFSESTLREETVELFIFLTPKIISDPQRDFDCLREKEMLRRPGDIPEFMCRLVEALDYEKNRLFAGTINALFGPMPDRCVGEFSCCPEGEYDGHH